MPRPLSWRAVLGTFILTVVLLAGWGVGFEPGWLQERKLELSTPAWPTRAITIAVAADLHVGTPHAGPAMVERLIDGILAAKPDLILLPGDFVTRGVPGSSPLTPEEIARLLSRLKAPLGVYATLGNHDWSYDGHRVTAALEGVGIRVLENAAVPLDFQGQSIWLAGIGDAGTGHADIGNTFRQVPAGASTLVMMHNPANAPEVPGKAAVAFAGHTHGGQVRLPFFGAIIMPDYLPRRYAYSWIPAGPIPTYVTSGVGTSILPVRFNCPPEYLLLRLSGKEKT